jgi:dTDP-4-amino-4,6-dideoxygalactose transaminase
MILMNDFKAEPQRLRDAMNAAAARVIESGWYVLGNEVRAFEGNWASLCGVEHAVGVGNGMDAIEISLRALGIGRGDEVITTPMTAFATVLAILRAGATPVLADIDPDTALLSIESVQRCVGRNTKAVLLVHLYGQLRDGSAWQTFCNDRSILLLEDCAQAHLAAAQGRVAGSFGAAGAYSFYPTKNLGAPGDAGMLVTDDPGIAERAGRLRNYGQSVRYHHPQIGLNSRLDELQAAILNERLRWLSEFTKRRQEIASAYLSGIQNPEVTLLSAPQEPIAHVYHLFVIVCRDRSGMQRHLERCGVQTLIHYPIPVHHQEPCRDLRCDPQGLAQCERHAARCLSLPCHPQMTNGDIETVIEAVNSYRSN